MYSVQNAQSNVPSQVLDIFYGLIPFGSDYVIYTVRNTASLSEYCLLYRKIGSKNLSSLTISHQSGGDYVFGSESDLGSYTGVEVASPVYAYSNIKGQGRYTVLPSAYNLMTLMLIVCASLMVLKTVFGGVRLWRDRRKSSVY